MSAAGSMVARRLALAGLAVGVALASLLLAAHLPWVQARVAAWVASGLEARGILIRSRSLSYNLAARSVHVEGLVVSTTSNAQQPFLEVDGLDVTLPWSVFSGRPAITSLHADGVRVVLERRRDGSTNMPLGQGGATGSLSSLPIAALTLSNMSIAWRDDVLGLAATAGAVSVNVDHGRGNVLFGRSATLRAGDHQTSVAASTGIAWDGATLSFDALRLQAPEATLNAAGSVGLLAVGHLLTIEGDGSADFARLAPWIAPGQGLLGRATFRLHAAGNAADPNADVTIASPDLAWQGLTGVSVDAAMHIDRNALDAGRFSVRALGGTATGRGRIGFAAGGERARVAFDWQNVDAASLLAALGWSSSHVAGARFDGHATVSAAGWSIGELTGSLDATTRTPPASRGLGLGGTLTLAAREGSWRGTIDQWVDDAVHMEGHADGRLSAASLAASTMNAAIVATADSLPALWRTLHRFDLAPGSPPESLPGSARADVTLSGRVDEPRLAGRIEAALPALDRWPADRAPNLKASGAVSLSAAVSGTVRAPEIDGRLAGEALSIAGQRADHLDASFGLNAQVARLQSLVLTQGSGRLTAEGQYDLQTSRVTARLAASNVTVGPVPGTRPGEILVLLDGRLSGEMQLGGTIADLRGSGQLTLDGTRVLERDLGRVSTSLTLADHQLRFAAVLADLSTTGTATLALPSSPAPGAFVIDMQTTDADLAILGARLRMGIGVPVVGVASLTAHTEGIGSDIAHARTTLNLQRLDAAVGGVPVGATEPGGANWDGRTIDITGAAFGIGVGGRSQLRLSGRLGADGPGTLVASLDGRVDDLRQLALAFAPAAKSLDRLQVDGTVRIDARAPGSLTRPALSFEASVDDGRIEVAGQPEGSSLVLRASYGEGVLTLSRLDATWQAATVSATGDIPIALVAPAAPVWFTGGARGGPAATMGRLQARFESVTPSVLAPFVPAETLAKLTGLASGTLTLDTDRPVLASVHGQLLLDRLDLTVAGVALAQQQPTRVDVADGRARIAAWEWGGAGNLFTVGGSVAFDPTPALDVSVDGTIDLRALGAFVPQVTTGGRGTLAARLTGAPAAPQLNGRIDLERGELRMASPRLIVSDLSGTLLLSRDQVTALDVVGQMNGGSVAVSGSLTHSGLTLQGGQLFMTGRGLAMAIPDALKTEVDLDLTLAIDNGTLTLGGDATVLGGAYREPVSLASGFLQALQASPETIQIDQPPAVDAIALDVRVTTAEDIVVDNNYAQLGLAADVRIRGTIGAPTLLGRAEVREGGRVFLGGNVYQIVGSGAIDFANPARTEPDLTIAALTRVGGYDVTLTLKGPPATLQTTLTADPPLSQPEIVSLLVTGQVQTANAMAISSDQVIGYLSGEVLGVTGRALGLDALRVERGQDVRFDAGLVATETDPSSRLTFGKQVTRQVDVVFSQSLKDSGKLTWILGYRPKPNIELRMVSQDNEARIYDVRHDVTIGGDAVARPAAGRPASRVASVRFTGTPEAPEEDLRRRLKLTEGKTFDFLRWQQDRDRLEDWLRQGGHFEAHVVASRSGSPALAAAEVDLTYDVHRGPQTIIDLVGIPANRSLHGELERVWAAAVFDAFLLEQSESTARASMVRDGYPSASVTTSLTKADGAPEKHLVVSIVPGPHYARRHLAFSGQQHVRTSRLDELARARVSPWIDPAPLVLAITTMYRNEGFLDAGVTVGPPQFEGDVATLPVVIREGPQFRLESVTFAGPQVRTPAAAEAAFGLKPGAPLTQAAADAAVQALVASYRTDGFNAARVTLTNQATRATGLVALTVSVDEGRRQVVQDVTVDGARRTSPTLVSRELRLEVGQPADLAAWAQARRRLFDAGVFRQVDIQAVPIDPPTGDTPPSPGPQPVQNEQPVRAKVTLEEFPPMRVRYGFELNDEVQPASETRTLRPGAAADATYRNLFGRAASTGLAVRYTKDFDAVRGFVSTPSFFGLPLTSSLFVARSSEQLGTSTPRPYSVGKSEFTAEQRFRAGRRLQVAYSYSLERNHTRDVHFNPDDPGALDISINIAKLTATALVDTRDDLVDATRGVFTSSTFEYGIPALGSDLNFAKYFFQQNYYRMLRPGFVFATSGRLGLAAGYGQELIQSERFFAGGGNSVRGFGEGTLGPVDVFGDPAGGNALLVFNEELRFPIVWRVRGVGFVDAGNVFVTPGDLRIGELRAGTGAGLRVVTPFALLRFDLGVPVRARPGESRTRWFFSIGQSF